MILLDWEQKWAIIGWRHSLFTASWTRVYLGGWSLRSMITFGTLFLFVGWFSLHFFRGFFFFNCLLGGIWETLIFIYVFFFLLSLYFYYFLLSCPRFMAAWRFWFQVFFFFSFTFHVISFFLLEWRWNGRRAMENIVGWDWFAFYGVFFLFFSFTFYSLLFFFFTSVLGTNFSHFYLVFFFLLILTL